MHQEEDIGMSRNAITILIAKLTAILRLANSMDREPQGKAGGTAAWYPGK